MTADPLDQPEPDDAYGLLVPFVVCRSKGGPYDDDAFVAGFQAGEIDRSLVVAAAAGATELRFTVRTELVRQVELSAMARGFPTVTAEPWADHPDEWTFVTLRAGSGRKRRGCDR